jgi:GMP synthase-like glutamine amidotransferase
MKVHCIRHEAFEDIGCIREWIQARNYQISYTHVYLGEVFPENLDFDFLIIMGGSASVYESDKFPWLTKEINFILAAIAGNKKILGICLGAQLIAKSLGALVFPGNCKEIGWFPVKFNADIQQVIDFLGKDINTFHWHGDTFALPEGAISLGYSEFTPQQGFIRGKNILALQFHPEITVEGIEMLIKNAGYELSSEGESTQSVEKIIQGSNFINVNNQLMFSLLNYLVE